MAPRQSGLRAGVADELDRYHKGETDMVRMLNSIWQLFEDAGPHDPSTRERFMALYYAVTTEDDMLQPWMPAGHGSEERLRAALTELEQWAVAPGGTDRP